MGMSDDLEAAISQGSTWVRIGSALFGARDYSPAKPASSAEKSSIETIKEPPL
jgi:hypothetical protein